MRTRVTRSRFTRATTALIAAATLSIGLAACSDSGDGDGSGNGDGDGDNSASADLIETRGTFPQTVSTKFGDVTVDEPPQRVVALAGATPRPPWRSASSPSARPTGSTSAAKASVPGSARAPTTRQRTRTPRRASIPWSLTSRPSPPSIRTSSSTSAVPGTRNGTTNSPPSPPPSVFLTVATPT